MLQAVFEAVLIGLVAAIGIYGVLWPVCQECFWMIFGDDEESD